MRTIGAFEEKNRLSELLQVVENGEEVTITKHGRAVARLVPVDDSDKTRVREAIEWLKRTRKDRSLGDLKIRELIDAGRKY